MAVIESIRDKKQVWLWMSIGMIIVAGILIIYQLRPTKNYDLSVAFFTDDDGASWYSDDVNNIPPYSHDGKDAVRANIYSCDNGSNKFCGYLMRFGPKVKAALGAAIAAGANANPPQSPAIVAYGQTFGPKMEVKKPQSNGPWVPINSAAGREVCGIHTPDGSDFDAVLP